MQARKDRLIGRTSLALGLGISTDRLFSYEKGRAKLPWLVGNRACELMQISQEWLAGTTRNRGPYVWSEKFDELTDPDVGRRPFSEVYVDRFAPILEEERLLLRTDLNEWIDDVKGLLKEYSEGKKTFDRPSLARLADRLRTIASELETLEKKIERPPT